MNAKPISATKPSGFLRVAMFSFGAIFLVAGCVAFWYSFLSPAIKAYDARSWVSTECMVVHSIVDSHWSDDGTTYTPEITFEFVVAGQRFQSDAYDFVGLSASREWAQSIVSDNPVGKETVCYYDPTDPSDAVLNRDFSWSNLFGLFTLLFVVIGAVVVYFSAIGLPKGVRSGSGSKMRFRGIATESSGHPRLSGVDASEWEGPQKLKATSSVLSRLIGVSFFAIVWNCIVWSVFAFRDQGGGDIVSLLFFVVFALVGIGVGMGAIYQLLSMFNPTVEIAIGNGAVPLGAELDVACQVIGNFRRIRRLEVTIVGSEKATYTRGSSTCTDTHDFKKIEITSTEDKSKMEFIDKGVTIPADSMHSFDGGNNKVVWEITVKGDIPWWPDVNERFPFYVTPRGTE